MPAQPAEAVGFLQIRLDRRSNYGASQASIVGVTQRRPEQPRRGCIVVKIKLRIPVEGWDPFQPEAVIDVPADLIQHPIEVGAEDSEAD